MHSGNLHIAGKGRSGSDSVVPSYVCGGGVAALDLDLEGT